MKSDVVVVQFMEDDGDFNSKNIQKYLDGENQWNLPILEKDIIKIDYGFSTTHSERHGYDLPTSGILLVHRIPEK